MAPLPEDSPVSSPRTRSPIKNAQVEGTSIEGSVPNAMSMLNMLAEVASVTLHTDPSVTDTHIETATKSKNNLPTNRKPSEYEFLTLEQVAGMTDNLLVKLFAEFESNEMWKRFTFTCKLLPAACSKYYQSFGSEHKARSGMKAHLNSHLKNLLEVHKSESSRNSYVLESVPASRRRLIEQEPTTVKKRNIQTANRNTKTSNLSKNNQELGVTKISNKKNGETSSLIILSPQKPSQTENKSKRKLESQREGKVKIKKPRNADTIETSAVPIDDFNNNNNNDQMKTQLSVAVEPHHHTPPMQEIVSHDHGYLKGTSASSLQMDTPISSVDLPHQDDNIKTYQEVATEYDQPKSHFNQVSTEGEDTLGGCVNFCVKESADEVQNTLLHQHMNQELEGSIMAQAGTCATPLPVVGCEVEFTPDQQYKVMRSADLPVVYDHNNPATNVQTVSRVIERDEYKVRKKPKGRAKFIGQSKAEKEMALKLITEIRSQSVMSLDTLECKICHPPRLFTAPSTLLSHYRSHAGIRPYECRICEAVFTRQHSLNYHMLIHTNQTRFTCVDCGRKFRHPSHFKEHRRRHTGEAPYECSDCLMRFKTRNTYKRHLRTRHGKLLTTQGAIIILSQEEAEKMKKTQGRKPRRPRQPLQIISPETAAQMEEEQIWTDFEEADREEEEEDDDDEDGEDESSSPLDLTKNKQHLNFVDTRFASKTIIKPFETQKHTVNGKTGCIKPKKINVNKAIDQLNSKSELPTNLNWENYSYEYTDLKEEIVKDEVVDNFSNDPQTYIYSAQATSIPSINTKSSWNSDNTKNIVSFNSSTANAIVKSEPNHHVIERVSTVLQSNNTDVCGGDNITPDEVITICADFDSVNKDVISSSLVESKESSSPVIKTETFTVKKPLKCYGRPVLNANILANPSINSNPINSWGQGVYVYVEGQDGRLAKVYQDNVPVMSTNGQSNQLIHTFKTVASKSSVSDGIVTSVANKPQSIPLNSLKPVRISEVRDGKNQINIKYVKSSPVRKPKTVIKQIHTFTPVNGGFNSNIDNKVVINKQVVNNVVLKNHIVQNGNLVKINSKEFETSSSYSGITSHTLPIASSSVNYSPPVIVTSVTPSTVNIKQGSSPIVVTSITTPVTSKPLESPPVSLSSLTSVSNPIEVTPSPVLTSTGSLSSAKTLTINVTPDRKSSVGVQGSSLPLNVSHIQNISSKRQKFLINDSNSEVLTENVLNEQPAKIVTVECLTNSIINTDNQDRNHDKANWNPVLCTSSVDPLIVKDGILLDNVEIIESVDKINPENLCVNATVESDGTVKLEDYKREFQMLKIEGNATLLPCSDSNIEPESLKLLEYNSDCNKSQSTNTFANISEVNIDSYQSNSDEIASLSVKSD